MKTVILSIAAMLIVASSAVDAQPKGRRGPPNPAERVERLTADLQLSDEQASSVLAILQSAQPTARPEGQAREKTCGDGEARKAQHEAIDQQIAAVLSETQRQQFEVMRAERSTKRHGEGKAKSEDCAA